MDKKPRKKAEEKLSPRNVSLGLNVAQDAFLDAECRRLSLSRSSFVRMLIAEEMQRRGLP